MVRRYVERALWWSFAVLMHVVGYWKGYADGLGGLVRTWHLF